MATINERLENATVAIEAAKTQFEALLSGIDDLAIMVPRATSLLDDSNPVVWSDTDLEASKLRAYSRSYASQFAARRTAIFIVGSSQVTVRRRSSTSVFLRAQLGFLGDGSAAGIAASRVDTEPSLSTDDIGESSVNRTLPIVGAAIKNAGVADVSVYLDTWWSAAVGSQGESTAFSGLFDNFHFQLIETVVDEAFALPSMLTDNS